MKHKFLLIAMLALATFSLMTGCTGIRASGTVTPLTFLLPVFLGKNETQPVLKTPAEPTQQDPLVAAR